MKLPYVMPATIMCPVCSAPLSPQLPDVHDAYFEGIKSQCPQGNHNIDWWEMCTSAISQNFLGTFAFGLIGATQTLFEFNIRRDSTTTINLDHEGVPNDAKVLAINYTPKFGLFPVQLHGNLVAAGQEMWTSADGRHEFHIYGRPQGVEGEVPEEVPVSCMVSWIVVPPGDPVAINLTRAFSANATATIEDAIFPAHVAAEVALSRIIDKLMLRQTPKAETTRQFLKNSADFSSKLNVLLPCLAKLFKVPDIPDKVRDKLNHLRKLRNKIAHEGITKGELGAQEEAELLAASVFAVAYADYLTRSTDESVQGQ